MDKIENINNLTLAQLIEIWEFCNGAEDCKKCPLNDKHCAEILHTATLEALKNLVQLVDLQKEEIDDYKRDTIPRLQDALNRANKYGMNADKEINRLDTALASALKFNSDFEADKRLANVELDRLNSEVLRFESDCKTLSAVLSKDVDHDKELISTFVGFLEEHARDWIFQRPNAGYEYTLKYVYIEEDVKRLEKEFWEGDNNNENQHNNV